MERLGRNYICPCKEVKLGTFGIRESFKVLESASSSHVSLRFGFSSGGFTTPCIKRSDDVEVICHSNLDYAVDKRVPIYSLLSSMLFLVEVSGTLMKGTNTWAGDTRCDLFSCIDTHVDVAKSPDSAVTLLYEKYKLVDVLTVRSISLGSTVWTFPEPVNIRDAILHALKSTCVTTSLGLESCLKSKKNFYLSRQV